MNVFYFVRRFPRRYKTAAQQKIFSLAETLLNQGHKINFVSADQSHPNEYDFLKQYPVNLIPISPKRISASLSAAQIKPDIALFNTFEMEEMYSAYMYNKWAKCLRILQINNANGLQKWRKVKYTVNLDNFLLPYNEKLYDQNEKSTIFNSSQQKSILRSDFYITPNDFLYYLLAKYLGQSDRISILTHGYPTKQFSSQIKQGQVRPFQNRKHFIFMGNFTQDSCNNMLHHLVYFIWPLVKKQLPEAQFHIYGTAMDQLKIGKKLNQIQKNGIFLKGYTEDIDLIQKYKLMLYPARFSVGLKSKVIESFLHHTPVITTPVGAEGMFHQALQAKYAQSQSSNSSGFINQREFTSQETQGQKRLRTYYSSNSLGHSSLKNLHFGGSFLNYSHIQFAQSSISLYKNKQKWQNSLKIAQKTILKNQNQSQLEINLRQALLKAQLGAFKARGNKQYEQEWNKHLRSKNYQKRVYEYK